MRLRPRGPLRWGGVRCDASCAVQHARAQTATGKAPRCVRRGHGAVSNTGPRRTRRRHPRAHTTACLQQAPPATPRTRARRHTRMAPRRTSLTRRRSATRARRPERGRLARLQHTRAWTMRHARAWADLEQVQEGGPRAPATARAGHRLQSRASGGWRTTRPGGHCPPSRFHVACSPPPSQAPQVQAAHTRRRVDGCTTQHHAWCRSPRQ
jgi:hypothetical protein